MPETPDRPCFTVFTKPWKALPLPELGKFVHGLGFDGVELPVRPGFQIEPDNVAAAVSEAARVLADFGVRIVSIAGPTDEKTIAACAEAGVGIIRICVGIPPDEGYLAAEQRIQRQYDALVPALDAHGVTVGVQNHCDRFVPNALALRSLIGKYDPKHFAAVWDPAHCALDGERPELAVDIVWSHLCMVNLKNAVWVRKTGPEAAVVEWRHHWTSGRQGLCHWPTVVSELKRRDYRGPVCLTAEYSDHDTANRLIAEDLAFARGLFA
jgi:sugar phosphate isomerase/epimerase